MWQQGQLILIIQCFLATNTCMVTSLFPRRIRTPSSDWFSLRAGSTGWPGTTRPRESWPPTGSSKLSFFVLCTVHCPALLLSVLRYFWCAKTNWRLISRAATCAEAASHLHTPTLTQISLWLQMIFFVFTVSRLQHLLWWHKLHFLD